MSFGTKEVAARAADIASLCCIAWPGLSIGFGIGWQYAPLRENPGLKAQRLIEKAIFIWNTPGTNLWPEYHVITHAFFWETPEPELF